MPGGTGAVHSRFHSQELNAAYKQSNNTLAHTYVGPAHLLGVPGKMYDEVNQKVKNAGSDILSSTQVRTEGKSGWVIVFAPGVENTQKCYEIAELFKLACEPLHS